MGCAPGGVREITGRVLTSQPHGALRRSPMKKSTSAGHLRAQMWLEHDPCGAPATHPSNLPQPSFQH